MKLTKKISIVLWVLCTSLVCLHTQAQTTTAVKDITIELPSGQRFYRDSGGTGVPVLFLHAGSGNSMLWEYQIPAFTAAGYRFIAINYGGPARPAVGGTLDTTPAPYINELMAKLGIQKFHLLGTAAGGGLALTYALANGDKLRSITIANSIGSVQDKEYSEMGSRIRPPQFDQLPLEFREMGPSYRAANPEGVKRWLALSSQGREVTPPGVTTPTAPPTAGGQSTRAANPNAVTWEKLEAFKVPTLLMTGDADLYTPPSVLRMFSARMKHAEYAVIPESGHTSFWENPQIFNNTVLAFISKH